MLNHDTPHIGRRRRVAAAVLAATLLVGACGGSDEESSDTTVAGGESTGTTAAPLEPAGDDTAAAETVVADTAAVDTVAADIVAVDTVAADTVAAETTVAPTTVAQTTVPVTTTAPTTVAPTTVAPTTGPATTAAPKNDDDTNGSVAAMTPPELKAAIGKTVGTTDSITKSLQPIVELPYEVPTPAGLDLQGAQYSVANERDNQHRKTIYVTGFTKAPLKELVSFYETKYAALKMPEGSRSSGEDDGLKWTTISFEAETGGLSSDADIELYELEGGRQAVQYWLFIDGKGHDEVARLASWADGFPGTNGMQLDSGEIDISYVNASISGMVRWSVDDEIDPEATMKKIRAGLPWNGFSARKSEFNDEEAQELKHGQFAEGTRVTANDYGAALYLEYNNS